jgi:hypothetical protein
MLIPISIIGAPFLQSIVHHEWAIVSTGIGTFIYLVIAMSVAPKHKVSCGILLVIFSIFFTGLCLPIDAYTQRLSYIGVNILAGLLACWLNRTSFRQDNLNKLVKQAESAEPEDREPLLQKIRARCDRDSELYHQMNLQLAELFRLSSRFTDAERLARETACIRIGNAPKKRVWLLKQSALRELARICRDQGREGDANEFYMQALTFSASEGANPIDTDGLLKEAKDLAENRGTKI